MMKAFSLEPIIGKSAGKQKYQEKKKSMNLMEIFHLHNRCNLLHEFFLFFLSPTTVTTTSDDFISVWIS